MTKDGVLLEILLLLFFGLLYLVIRYLLLRRPITYLEFEKYGFILIAFGFASFFVYVIATGK